MVKPRVKDGSSITVILVRATLPLMMFVDTVEIGLRRSTPFFVVVLSAAFGNGADFGASAVLDVEVLGGAANVFSSQMPNSSLFTAWS